mmetsp:Transcript_18242/g.28437  ORF Transcript_18242/g.28437 Transcript_18242/m.28437 type:complete len:132 (+) Transcript_18242:69-464(+)
MYLLPLLCPKISLIDEFTGRIKCLLKSNAGSGSKGDAAPHRANLRHEDVLCDVLVIHKTAPKKLWYYTSELVNTSSYAFDRHKIAAKAGCNFSKTCWLYLTGVLFFIILKFTNVQQASVFPGNIETFSRLQ